MAYRRKRGYTARRGSKPAKRTIARVMAYIKGAKRARYGRRGAYRRRRVY